MKQATGSNSATPSKEMSIRLRSGGLSFSAYSPSVSESFFYRDVEFDRTRPYVSSLKECFFENDFLTWFYKQVNVVCVTF